MIEHEQQSQEPVAVASALDNSAPRCPDADLSQVRPWIRYWARMFDIYLTGLVLGIALGIVAPRVLNVPGSNILFGFAILLVWVFVEALLLSLVGITPGKWLLKTRLVPPSGQKPSFGSALSRSVKVWWRGLGVGFPIISIVTLIIARSDLKESGATTWDKDTGFKIVHGRIGFVRVTVVVLFFCVFAALVVVGSVLNA